MTQSIRASLSSRLFPLAAVALAIVIFLIDTFSPLGMAVAVLYVIVILIAANFCEWRGVLLVALGCGALTLISFCISHGMHYEKSRIRPLPHQPLGNRDHVISGIEEQGV